MTPSKATKEPEKPVEKEEKAVEEPTVVVEETGNDNGGCDEDELIIKDDLDNDCFEEVDRIGEIEKEVKTHKLPNNFF